MPQPATGPVAEHISKVNKQIAQMEKDHSREPGSVSLLAVSKTKPADLVRQASTAGHTEFGENYVEEGVGKIQELADLNLTWHFIGHIQSNKTRVIARLKIDAEESKSGCTTTELDELAEFIDSAETLSLRGLMAIPAPRTELSEQRQVFAELHSWYEKLRSSHASVDTLSMGMSGDMEAAIAEGATMVRIGTAVFGSRDKR